VSSAEHETLLEVDGLVTRYPVQRGVVGAIARRPKETVHAVEGVSFTIAAGEMVALVGESGCGKTSTAQTVVRMVDSEQGAIRFRGREISQLSARSLRPLRREIQMIYQDPYESLDPRFTVRDTIEEPLVVHRIARGNSGNAPPAWIGGYARNCVLPFGGFDRGEPAGARGDAASGYRLARATPGGGPGRDGEGNESVRSGDGR